MYVFISFLYFLLLAYLFMAIAISAIYEYGGLTISFDFNIGLVTWLTCPKSVWGLLPIPTDDDSESAAGFIGGAIDDVA